MPRLPGRPPLGPIIALPLLLLAGCSRPDPATDDGARAAAVAFLDAIRAGRIEPAWQATSGEFKSLMGLQNLEDYVRSHPPLSAPAEFAEARPVDREGLNMAEYVFRSPEAASIIVLVAENDGGWTVERLSVE